MYGYEIAISEAFTEKIRLRIVLMLWGSKICVKCMTQVLQCPQSTISRHLAILRRAGIVRDERSGLHTFYSLDFGGEFGQLKKNLISSYFKVLRDKEPYEEDIQQLEAMHQEECSVGCEIKMASEKCLREVAIF